MNFTKDREEIVRLRQESADAYQLLQWAKRHPDLNCQANISVLKAYINQDEISESVLEEATAILLSQGKLAILPPAKQQENAEQQQLRMAQEKDRQAAQLILDRANLQDAILDHITSQSAKEHERRQLQYKSLDELKARLQELVERASLKGMDVEQLHQFVRRKTAPPAPVIEKVTLNKKEILALSQQAMRSLLYDKAGREKPGVRDQINAILRGN